MALQNSILRILRIFFTERGIKMRFNKVKAKTALLIAGKTQCGWFIPAATRRTHRGWSDIQTKSQSDLTAWRWTAWAVELIILQTELSALQQSSLHRGLCWSLTMAASGMFSAVCRNRWYTCSSQMGAVWHQSKSPPAWWMICQPPCMTGLRILLSDA